MINYFYIFIFLTIAVPGSFSRIITTVDPPSSYTINGISKETGSTLFTQDYDNKIGINIAYQQIIFYRGNFNKKWGDSLTPSPLTYVCFINLGIKKL